MRKSAILALGGAALMALAGCSQETQEKAENTAESAGEDVGGAAVEASAAVDDAAQSVGEAADRSADAINEAVDDASAAAGRVGDKVEQGADRARSRIHEETAPDSRPN